MVEVAGLRRALSKLGGRLKLAVLFGSQVAGKAGMLSDFDIGIVPEDGEDLLELISDVAAEVARELGVTEDRVDVVVLNPAGAPYELVYRALAEGILLYCKSRELFLDLMLRAWSLQADLSIYLRKHRLVESYFERLRAEEHG